MILILISFQDYSDEMLENTQKFDNFAVAGWGMTSAFDENSFNYIDVQNTDDLMKLDLNFINSVNCKVPFIYYVSTWRGEGGVRK